MTAARRWAIVAVGVLLLVAAPVLVRALPAPDRPVGAATLLARIQASGALSFSGYVETAGNLALPSNQALTGLTDLFGGTSKVRVWWADPRTWRVATLRPTGETDLVHQGRRTVRWEYESRHVTLLPDVPVRLPQTTDLIPNELARRSLSGARPGELSRLPARRVAGRDALGLRLTPADPQAAIGRVEVYVDRASSVPLRVDLFARGSRRPAVVSRFIDFSPGRPPVSALVFNAPKDAEMRYDPVVDLASAADRFTSRIPPRTLAGLPARGRGHGSVGAYGRGPTVLLAVPLWSRTAERIRADLRGRPGVRTLDQGVLLAAPPLRMLLAEPEPTGTSWLLAGTVTRGTLTDAADALAGQLPGLRGQP